jgi:hypothetical protein
MHVQISSSQNLTNLTTSGRAIRDDSGRSLDPNIEREIERAKARNLTLIADGRRKKTMNSTDERVHTLVEDLTQHEELRPAEAELKARTVLALEDMRDALKKIAAAMSKK